MKLKLALLVFLLLQISLNRLVAQSLQKEFAGSPLKMDKSILFGFDTYLNNKPLQNQRNAVICSAFNGWLYATYSYFDNNIQQDATTILRSKDNGASWVVLFDQTMGEFHNGFSKMNILVCGHDTTNLKVFVGYGIFDTLTLVHCKGSELIRSASS